MRLSSRSFIYSAFIAAFAASATHAAEVEGLVTFTAGTPARASEVNSNFAAVKAAVDDTHADVVSLQEAITALQNALAEQATRLSALEDENAVLADKLSTAEATIAALETQNAALASQVDDIWASNVMDLDPYLSVTEGERPNVLFKGVNVQIVNGMGSTATVNGVGNLIVGYNEERLDGDSHCSYGNFDANSCLSDGHEWQLNHKSGSHNVIVGAEHNYSKYGGIVAGRKNSSAAPYASVSGGTNNWALLDGASVSGGTSNRALSYYSSVSGGSRNTAAGTYSSVSGGEDNQTFASYASVSGGSKNTASSLRSSISGGKLLSTSQENGWIAGTGTEQAPGP